VRAQAHRTDITEPFVLQDGHSEVSREPGLGRSPIPELLEAVTESKEWIAP
jgi:O-succinylbenzoate synthase